LHTRAGAPEQVVHERDLDSLRGAVVDLRALGAVIARGGRNSFAAGWSDLG